MLNLVFLAGLLVGYQSPETASPVVEPIAACVVSNNVFVGGKLRGDAIINTIAIRRNGAMFWNGFELPYEELPKLFRQIAAISPQPITVLLWETGVDCSEVGRVVNFAELTQLCEDELCFQRADLNELPEEALENRGVGPWLDPK